MTRHRLLSFGTALLVGIVVYVVVPAWLRGATRFVAAYDASALTLLYALWQIVSGCDPAKTRQRAALDDPGRNIAFLVVLAAVVVGLVSAIAILGHGPQVANPTEKWVAYLLGVVAVTAGWFLVHTVYTFRYAHLYWYDDDEDGQPGGFTFPNTPEPADIDFAYFSFCLGTSFAVSDIIVTESEVRKEVLRHSVISFAYNSVIVGMVINVLAGIFSTSGGK
jgi:uncharacterized membrane protein